MTDTFDILLRAFLGACGAGLLTLIIMAIKWFAKKIKADDMTIKALAHDAYFRHCRYLLLNNENNEISESESENHDFLHDAYKAQGLNGTGDRMHEEIMKLKVVPNKTIEKE